MSEEAIGGGAGRSGEVWPGPNDHEVRLPLRVSMVCTGNICRSPIAEAVLRQRLEREGIADLVEVSSAGTHAYHVGEDADHRALATLRRHGYELRHRAHKITAAELAGLDLVLTMDSGHYRHVVDMARASRLDVEVLPIRGFEGGDAPLTDPTRDVPDPYYGPDSGFEEVLAMLEHVMPEVVAHILERLGRS